MKTLLLTISLALSPVCVLADVSVQGSGNGTQVTITAHVGNSGGSGDALADGEATAALLLSGWGPSSDECDPPDSDTVCRESGYFTGTPGEILCGNAQSVASGGINYVDRGLCSQPQTGEVVVLTQAEWRMKRFGEIWGATVRAYQYKHAAELSSQTVTDNPPVVVASP